MNSMLFSSLGERIKLRWSISVFLVIASIFLASINTLLQNNPFAYKLSANYHTALVMNALQSKVVNAMTPILSTLSFSASYVEERETKFVRFILIRSGYTSYILNRIFVCYILGESALVIGAVLAWQIATVLFPPFEVAASDTISDMITMLNLIWLLGLNGGMWATAGMAISAIIENKYISYVAPFIIYYLLTIISERYLPNQMFLSPINWMKLENWPFGVWGTTIFLVEVSILCGAVFVIRAEKRLREL